MPPKQPAKKPDDKKPRPMKSSTIEKKKEDLSEKIVLLNAEIDDMEGLIEKKEEEIKKHETAKKEAGTFEEEQKYTDKLSHAVSELEVL